MTIYTKKGDKGKTNLFSKKGCDLVWKDDPRVDALGVIDEVNSFLGIIISELESLKHLRGVRSNSREVKDFSQYSTSEEPIRLPSGMIVKSNEKLARTLKDIQKDLLTIGSIISGSDLRFPKSKTKKLEKIIDEIEKDLPKLKNFILAGGSKVTAKLHFARALTRRAERIVISLNRKQKINPAILTYLNRLSDTLFILARRRNFNSGIPDEIWTKRKR